MTTGRKYSKDKFFTEFDHTATSGVVGDAEYEVWGEINLRVVADFTASGTLTIQGRIHHSDSWDNIGTLASGGDTDSFDISTYDYIRFNFTVAAGSTGSVKASGFFKGSSAGAGGAANSFTIIQPDAGTSPTADSATDTLTMTSADSSVVITGDSATDSLDFVTRYSNPNATYSNSEFFGASSAVTGINSTAIGTSSSAGAGATALGETAVASGANSIAIGRGADVTQTNALGIGNNCFAVGIGSVAVGTNSYTGGAGGVAIGNGASNVAKTYSISIGQNAGALSDYSVNLGGVGGHIKNLFLGEGEYTNNGGAQLSDITIRPTRPSARTNVVGGDLILMGAGSTGNLAGSSVKLQTQTATSASGTTDNVTWEDMIEANGLKEVILNAEDSATADASLWTNSISFYLDETGNTLVVKAKYGAGTVKTGTVALT